MLLKKSSQILILLRLTDELNCDIFLLVNPSVDSAVSARGKFGSNEQLRHICTPFFFSFSLYLSPRRHQILRPWHCAVVLPKWKPSPQLATVGNLLVPPQVLHVAHTHHLSKPSKFNLFPNPPAPKCRSSNGLNLSTNAPIRGTPKWGKLHYHGLNGKWGYHIVNFSHHSVPPLSPTEADIRRKKIRTEEKKLPGSVKRTKF